MKYRPLVKTCVYKDSDFREYVGSMNNSSSTFEIVFNDAKAVCILVDKMIKGYISYEQLKFCVKVEEE